jgi:hypothetical protein
VAAQVGAAPGEHGVSVLRVRVDEQRHEHRCRDLR